MKVSEGGERAACLGLKIEEGPQNSGIKISPILMNIFENQSQCYNPR